MIAARDLTSLIEPSLAQSASAAVTGKPRFTLDGSVELESHLEQTCRQVLAAIRNAVPERKLEAVLLGGGYGRGEGGVWKTRTGDRPYNDLELYVFLRGNNFLNSRRYHAVLNEVAEKLTPIAGVEVEFKVLSLGKLRRSPVSMFYYDLVMGHRWLLGEEDLLIGCEHHRQADRIPLSEATRLLLNRCTGLLLAGERLDRPSLSADAADFVSRNLAKAKLAFGDAVLAAVGQYHWSCRERHRRLEKLVNAEDIHWLPEVFRLHKAGVEFKLSPQPSQESKAALQALHAEIAGLALSIWLWLETRRLHHPFASAWDYALSPLNKCPESGRLKNAALNLCAFGPSAVFDERILRHPRERLLHALALLLCRSGAWEESVLVRRIQKELRGANWHPARVDSRTKWGRPRARALSRSRSFAGTRRPCPVPLAVLNRPWGLAHALAAYTSLWRRFR